MMQRHQQRQSAGKQATHNCLTRSSPDQSDEDDDGNPGLQRSGHVGAGCCDVKYLGTNAEDHSAQNTLQQEQGAGHGSRGMRLPHAQSAGQGTDAQQRLHMGCSLPGRSDAVDDGWDGRRGSIPPGRLKDGGGYKQGFRLGEGIGARQAGDEGQA